MSWALGVLGGAPAAAQPGAEAPADARNRLDDVLLELSTRGATADVAARLTALSHELPTADPVRVDVLYWLGRVNERRGNVDEARAALLDGIRTGRCPECRVAFQDIEIARRAATRPTTWTFDGDGEPHGVFHPTTVEGLGSIRLANTSDRLSVLSWQTERRGPTPDRLVLGLRDGLEAVDLVVRAVDRPASLVVAVVDLAGRRFSAPAVDVPVDVWTTVSLRAADLTDPDGPPLRGAEARRLEIVEVPRTDDEPVTVWLDAVSVR